MPAYEPNPAYPPVGGDVHVGWDALVATLPSAPFVLALDGPAILAWDTVIAGLRDALSARSMPTRTVRMEEHFAVWERIVEATSTPELADDPDFARLALVELRAFFDHLPSGLRTQDAMIIVAGPGAALVEHDVLWYADLPKRYAEAAVGRGEAAVGRGEAWNLGQPATAGRATTKRLFYIDWTILDRHREWIAPAIDLWLDAQDPLTPTALSGATLRETANSLAKQPFRTRPTFNTAPWGGHWGQRQLGLGVHAENTAVGYELIGPESGVLIGKQGAKEVEVPFQLLVALRPEEILGPAVRERFASSFPIRFDYLDTVDGGNLSVHLHPQPTYMRDVFGWPYPQHETYYMMVGGVGRIVFLGLRGDVDLDAFERAARAAVDHGTPLRIEEHVQTFPAEQHRLFMIPGGTPHGSGEGNVVLEVSATPYLYSLRFYDWLRRDSAGRQRPVHVDHAFANLNRQRRGKAVARELIQEPRVIRSGVGWREELLGALPDVFFEVRRMVLEADAAAEDETNGRFHLLNVVEGDGVHVETDAGPSHRLNYAETMVIPAAVGRYSLAPIGADRVRIVKALVR
jgi:hypothetical protein